MEARNSPSVISTVSKNPSETQSNPNNETIVKTKNKESEINVSSNEGPNRVIPVTLDFKRYYDNSLKKNKMAIDSVCDPYKPVPVQPAMLPMHVNFSILNYHP